MTACSYQAVTHHGQSFSGHHRHLQPTIPRQPEYPTAGWQHHAHPLERDRRSGQAHDQRRTTQRPATPQAPGAKHPVRHCHRTGPQRRANPGTDDGRRQPQTPAATARPYPALQRRALKLALLGLQARLALATRAFDLHRREGRRCVAHHQDCKRQQQNAAAQVDDAHVRRVVVRHVGDQQTRERSDRHVDQEAHRHVVGLDLVPVTHTCHRVDFHHC